MTASALLLPDRVASHFGLYGQANAWMSKESDLLFLGAVGVGLPLFILGLTYVARFFPDSTFNLPHKDYWLAPERRRQTVDFLFHHTFWAVALTLLLLSWVNLLLIIANRQPQPQLSTSALFAGFIPYVIAMVFWIVGMIRHFNRPAERAS